MLFLPFHRFNSKIYIFRKLVAKEIKKSVFFALVDIMFFLRVKVSTDLG